VGISGSGYRGGPLVADEFPTAVSWPYGQVIVPLWMGSWQVIDSIPIGCGRLWIPALAHPPTPRAVHEPVHAARGYVFYAPQPSTPIHDLSTAVPHNVERGEETRSKRCPSASHRLSTGNTPFPHAYPQVVCGDSPLPGDRQGIQLMHTRGNFSTIPGLLSTLSWLHWTCRNGVDYLRMLGKIGHWQSSIIYPQQLWITRQVVDNYASRSRQRVVDERCKLSSERNVMNAPRCR
jgi:hypothetical protein